MHLPFLDPMANNFELDHAYLRQTISAPLTEAMAQLAILQPEDPVEFLGNYLLKHVANVETQQQLQKRKERVDTSTPSENIRQHLVGVVSGDADQQIRTTAWEQFLEEEQQVHAELQSQQTVTMVFQRFLEWICLTLNAEEAYIGRKCVNPQGNSIVHFVASSKHPGSPVVDKFVVQSTDEGDEEEIRRGVGVTFDVFKEITPIGEDGSPAVDTEGNPLPAAPPKFVHVENVLRDPRVKFFGVPKLGALLTRAGQYKSYLHADVHNESNPEEPNVLEQWLVFSIDTMSQARTFTKKEIDRFRHATELFLTTLEEKERALYMKDNERRVSSDEPLLREFLVAFSAQVAVQEENLAAQLPAAPEGEELSEAAQQQRASKEAELRISFLTTLLASHISTLSLASTQVVPFKAHVLTTFATALELLGYSRHELYNPATGQPSWDKISPLLEETILSTRLQTFEASLAGMTALAEADSSSAKGLRAIRNALPATTATISQAKQTITEISKADVDAASPVASCFYLWTLAAIARAENLTTMVDQAQQLEDEAAAAAAETAGDA
ncbi:Flagellar radial spoke protein 2 [Phytophthora citrophthora]|uniref:Flagellar radial spoke protein 2 n=1 Tax=Phytophthora citrophthora TaxID=4793 RepID=A0AAD9LGX0_9STRA|nr:Flagellar radial spoke protein 2 [Phytophthora citrophthora]